MYCGDETGAVIGDIGSHTARFGYGGEDCPKVVLTSASYRHNAGDHVTSSEGKRQKVQQHKYSAPVSLLNLPPDDCFTEEEVGFVPIYSLNSNHKTDVDLSAFTSLWEYAFQSLSVSGRNKHTLGPSHENTPMEGPIDHPILSSIDPHHGEKHHAEILEVLFESLNAPAAYLAPSATLSAFAFGRQSALVVDVGHSSTRVTPVMDGYTLQFGSVISNRGGAWLGMAQETILQNCHLWNTPPCRDGVVPRYSLRHRDENLQKLKLAKESPFHKMSVHEVMYEMMTGPHVQPLAENSWFMGNLFSVKDENDGSMHYEEVHEQMVAYELPDGTRVDVGSTQTGKDLCHLPVRTCLLHS